MIQNALYFEMQLVKMNSSYDFRFFTEYLDDAKKSIKRQQKKVEKLYDDLVKREGGDDGQIYDYLEDDFTQHFKFNPNLLYNSIFITVFSSFEVYMFTCSKALFRHLNGKNEYKKPNRDIINGYRRTLSEKVDFTGISSEWDAVLKYRKMRNRIVHNNANLSHEEIESPGEDINDILSLKHVKINDREDSLNITDEKFILRFCSIAETIIKSVRIQLQALTRNAE